jgi:hypothetical protein
LPLVQPAIKEAHNGREEKESEEEVEVIDVCAGLVLGQRRQLWISRSTLRGASSSGRIKVRPLSFLLQLSLFLRDSVSFCPRKKRKPRFGLLQRGSHSPQA